MTAMEALVAAAIIVLSIVVVTVLVLLCELKALDWLYSRKHYRMHPDNFDKPSKFGWIWCTPLVLIAVAIIAFAILCMAASLMSA